MDRKRRSSERTRTYPRSYYNYGSEAYEYYPEVEYGRKLRGRSKSRTQRRVEKRSSSTKLKKAVKHITRYEYIKSSTGNFKIYFSIATFFLFVIMFVGIFAINTKKEAEIVANTEELKKLEANNSILQNEITKNINLEEIEKIAKNKLNMQKPEAHQIVYINIPKQSYTVQYGDSGNNSEDTDENSFSLKSIWNNLFGD